MSKIIEITVKDKIAETNFEEVVSFNSVYRLKFHFDDEWKEFLERVAVFAWEGGAAECLFTGDECEMPRINSLHSEHALIGVYSVNNGQRISSSLVRVRCRAGAFGAPQLKPVKSLHEQILDRLNQFENEGGNGANDGSLYIGDKTYDGSEDVTVTASDLGLADVATSGSYNDLKDKPTISSNSGVTSVNGQTGDVTISKNDLGLAKVAISGSYRDLEDKPNLDSTVTSVNGQTGDVTISKNDFGLAKVATTGDYDDLINKPTYAVTSVNGQTGDVTISKNDLGLATVAITGSYNDLKDKPAAGTGAVTSVNGQTGDVTISKKDLGLASVAISGSYNDLLNKPSFPVTSVNGQTGNVTITKNDLGLASVALSGSYNDLKDKPNLSSTVTSVNGQTGNVTITKNDLGLASVAISGSYNDLKDKPNLNSTVTSVNGQTGAVTISKSDLGLGRVTNERQMPIGASVLDGVDLDDLTTMGFYHVRGTESSPLTSSPVSTDNPTNKDARWCIMVINQEKDSLVVQMAFSERSDCAMRIRNAIAGAWGPWKTV